jgi:hypothetical protein
LTSENKSKRIIGIDLIFTFLPIIVLLLLKVLTLSFEGFFDRSDWSYISMILFGQSLLKLFTGVTENENRKDSSLITLHVALLIAFGLVPSILLLVIMETLKHNLLLIILQFVWLFLSVITYIFFGVVGNMLTSNKKLTESDFQDHTQGRNHA